MAAVSCGSAQAAGRALGIRPAIPRGAKALGSIPGSAQIDATVALTPRDPAQLAAYAQAANTPGSSVFRRYLSVAQFAQRFGAPASEIAAVRSTLAARGLSVGSLSANGLSLGVWGSASRMGSAFSTSFRRYRLASGRTAFANISTPVASAGLAGRAQAVFGLDTLPQLHPEGLERASGLAGTSAAPASAPVTPCTAASAAATDFGAFTADQIASAYGYPSLYGQGDAGAGASVALFELEPFSASDITSYQSCYGTSASVGTTPVDGGAGTGAGSGEAALDIEDVIGLAPDAAINVYEAPNTDEGVFDAYQKIISNDTEKVISTSWGLCEPEEGSSAAASENTLFEEAATQGQSIFAAVGDFGSDGCDTHGPAPTVDDPASQPFVTAVGGTTLTMSPRSETVWNDGLGRGATGGGVSQFWGQPSYQTGRVLPQSAISCGSGGTTCREIPDVSADADEDTGYMIFYSGGWTAFGGTSAAAPTWAALAALADGSPACDGTSVGFLNPGLYRVAASASAENFNDVTVRDNAYDGVPGYAAQAGYDMASGIGTPIAQSLVPALCGGLVTVTSPGPQTTLVGTPTSLALTAHSTTNTALTFSATGLPAGLTIDPSTGVISGTPTTPASSTVTVTATDVAGSAGLTSFNWTITSPSPPPTPTPSPAQTPSRVALVAPGAGFGQVGARVMLAIHATDNKGFALSYSAIGLPAGLSIDTTTGVISGTPRRAGTSTAHLAVTDGRGGSDGAVFIWTIAPPPRLTHARLKVAAARRATLVLSVSSGSPRIAISQVGMPKPPAARRFSFGRKSLAGMAAAAARSAHAAHVNAKVARGGTGLTFSFASAQKGGVTLSVPLKLKGTVKRGAHARVKIVIVDAAGVRKTSSIKLAL